MSIPADFKRAVFRPQTGKEKGKDVEVHFNPASLQYAITNTMKDQGSGNKKKQYVSQSAGKLTMDLVFDTTGDGTDVRILTEKVAKFMEPDEKKVPPVILFEWGTYKFQGMVESYKETIDFFAANGVPLRASINLTMSRQDKVFEASDTSAKFDTQKSPEFDAVQLPASSSPGAGNQSASSVAARGGDPRAGRAVAAANNLESMRFTSGPLTVGASVKLGAPVAFATGGASLSAGLGISGGAGIGISGGAGIGISGGAGIGISGGAGIGISAGAGISAGGGIGVSGGAGFGVTGGAGVSLSGGASFGAGAGFSASTGAGFSAGAGFQPGAISGASVSFAAGAGVVSASGGASFGGSASAGVSASEGAFAGLRTTVSAQRSYSIDTTRLIQRSESVTIATDSNATFRVGGQAVIEGSSSLSANVGASASLRARIQFDED